MQDNYITFKYRDNFIFNIISFICFIIFMILTYIIINNIESIPKKILYILLVFIIINVILAIISSKICVLKGKFIFEEGEFTYESISKTYTIRYDEIEYIRKDIYTDNTTLMKRENYIYKIKIKDDGSLLFKYYNDSLLDAIEELAMKSNLKIED